MRRLVGCVLPLALACSFDSSVTGSGEAGASSASSSSDATGSITSTGPGSPTGEVGPTTGGGVGMSASGTSGALDPTTGGPGTTGPGTLPDPTSDDTTTTSDDTTTTSDDTTTTSDDTTTMPDPPDPACLGPVPPLLVLVEDASVEFPMTKMDSQVGEGVFANSGVPELGNIEFTFAVPCDDDWRVWARVHDYIDGESNFDPDSFYPRADDGDEFVWRYGCQTEDDDDSWTWKRVRRLDGNDCDETSDWTLPLTTGAHTVRLRNREGESSGRRAAVARMVLSNDPNFVPTQ